MDYLRQEEIGNYRITIYPDYDADCPVTSWDLAACYLFGFSRGNMLSDDCDWREVWGKHGDSRHTMEDSLRELIKEYADFGKVVSHIKKEKMDGVRLSYDRSSRMWNLEVYGTGYWGVESKWHTISEIEPEDLKSKDWYYLSDLLDTLDKDDLVELLTDFGKDIHVSEWSTTGYCQGDYVEGIAFCTKERYDKMVGNKGVPWKEDIQKLIDSEVKEIGRWMWGDVLGYKLEKKVRFTKSYEDSEREDVDDFEWEDVDSCWGFYMEEDELIKEIMEEHGIKEDKA